MSNRSILHRRVLEKFLHPALLNVQYLQRLRELDKVSLYSLAGVELRAQTDDLAPLLQTLLLQSCLTATEQQ